MSSTAHQLDPDTRDVLRFICKKQHTRRASSPRHQNPTSSDLACSELPTCPLAFRLSPLPLSSHPFSLSGWIGRQNVPDGSQGHPIHNPIKLGLKKPKFQSEVLAVRLSYLPCGRIERPPARSSWNAFRQDRRARSMAFFTHS